MIYLNNIKKIKGPGVEENAMFLIKANAPINTEAHAYVQTQLSSGRIKLLIDENQAKVKLNVYKSWTKYERRTKSGSSTSIYFNYNFKRTNA